MTKAVTHLNDIAEMGGFADNYWSLRSADDLDLTPQQAFALAWFAAYSTSPKILEEANLPTTKTAAAELIGVSRPTLDKWLSDERLAVSGVQRLIDGWLPGLLVKSFSRLETIITSGKDSDANRSIQTVLDYDNARRGGAGPGVQVNIDQRQVTVRSEDIVKARQEVDEWEKARFIVSDG